MGENKADSKTSILQPLAAELGKDGKRISLPPLVAEISWTKNCIIIEKCKDPLEREFYIKITKRFGWTKDVLTNNIDNNAYEQFLVNQTNFDKTVAEKYRHQAKLAVKVEYTLKTSNAPIGVATYKTHDELPNELRALLPSPDEIEQIVKELD